MTILLDTHILLWWLHADGALPIRAAEVIADRNSQVMISAATIWEIAIKRAAGRLDTPDDLLEALTINDFGTLPISAEHAYTAGGLPMHHTDPFDRMLIAQAQREKLTLVSVDRRMSMYDVNLLPL